MPISLSTNSYDGYSNVSGTWLKLTAFVSPFRPLVRLDTRDARLGPEAVSDGGGKVRSFARVLRGAQRLAMLYFALARRLAQGLSQLPDLRVEPPHSNILFVDLVGEARARSGDLVAFFASRGVLVTGLYRLRFVTHLDVDAAGIDHTVAVMREFLAGQ